MPRYKEPFTLYVRKTSDGKSVFYYRTYDEDGRRTHGVSTGMSSAPAARNYCFKLFKAGKLVPKPTETFEDYTEDFWVWGKCSYIERCNNLKKAKKSISREHARTERGYLVNHIRPYFGRKKLTSIQERDVEDLIIHLRKTTALATGTINHILKIIKIIVTQALKDKLIYENPAKDVGYLDAQQQDRGVLRLDEVTTLLNPARIPEIWDGCTVTFAMNVVAATTGMRRGELLALMNRNVHSDYIEVTKSWGPITGVKKTTKTKDSRNVPIAPTVHGLLRDIMQGGPDDFTFSVDGGRKHYPENHILPRYYTALDRIGITKKERAERSLKFHSWRHFFNTMGMVMNIAPAKMRTVIGHKTSRMTDNYTHFRIEDFQEITDLQTRIFVGEDSL